MSANHHFSLPSSSSQKLTAVINFIAFAGMIATNCLSIFLPLNGKTQMQLSEQYANLFTPIGYTFSVWSFIYIFLFGFIIYQVLVLFIKRHRDKPRILAISPLFVGICICNAGWLFAWHYEWVTLSVFIMLVHLWLLVLMHDKLSLAIAWYPLSPKIWLDIPFSIYLGWICVATIANMAAWCISKGVLLSFLPPQVWTMIMLVAAMLIGIFYVFTRNNKFLALTIVWALFGIIKKRSLAGSAESHTIILTAGLAMGILLLIILFNTFRNREPEYRANMSA